MMGVSEKPKQQSSTRSTRTREAGKRGLEDISQHMSCDNKKKSHSSSTHESPMSPVDMEKSPPAMSSVSSLSSSGEGPHPQEEVEGRQPVDTKTLNNHVALIMNKLNSIEGNTSTLNNKVSSLFSKMETQSERLKGAESSLALHSQQIEGLQKDHSSTMQEVNSKLEDEMNAFKVSMRKDNERFQEGLRKGNELFRAELINVMNKKVDQSSGALKEQLTNKVERSKGALREEIREDFMEEQSVSREKNLIIMGLQEPSEGSEDRDLVKTLFKDRLGISNVDIETLYRMGKPGGTGPRPLMLKFHRLPDRNRVWFSKSKLKKERSRKIWLQEDLPKPMKVAQRNLYQAFKKARSMPDSFKSVQLRGTRLILDGKAYGEKDMESLPPALHPASLATRQDGAVVVFFGKASPLSNHHPSEFQLEGHLFSTMEQFLAWRRAKVSGKKALINRALASTNPVVCKGILNELREDKKAKWEEILDEVVTCGLRAKFEQNPELAQFLLDTYPKTLGEASLNKRWGIGLPLNSPNAFDTTKWAKEGNLLGKKLSEVRDHLRA